LKWVRNNPCLLCRRPADDAHHLRHVGGSSGIIGGKESDALTVPLCRFCHTELHHTGDEEFFWIRKRVDAEKWAEVNHQLWIDQKTTL